MKRASSLPVVVSGVLAAFVIGCAGEGRVGRTGPVETSAAGAPAADGIEPGPGAPAAKWVSYLAGLRALSAGCRPDGCEWRIFDPGTRRDTLFLRLPDRPNHIVWDRSFRETRFVMSGALWKAAWTTGAAAERVASIPGTVRSEYIQALWLDDESGRWRLWDLAPTGNGQEKLNGLSHVWEYSEDAGWQSLASLPNCVCEWGCECEEPVRPFVHDAGCISVDRLFEATTLSGHSGGALTFVKKEGGAGEDDGWFVYRSKSVPQRALKLITEGEDTSYIVAINHVNEESGVETPLRAGIVGFQEEGGFLLIAASDHAETPGVADMRTGRNLLSPPTAATFGVWVNPLRIP